jgi:UDP-N-acetylmuramyl-tripeptide synthetase
LDDASVDYFLACDINNKIGYGTRNKYQLEKFYNISDINLSQNKTEFSINNEKFQMPLIGEFNVYNAAAAICVAASQGIGMEKIKEILKQAKPTPGRLEVVNLGQPFTVIVDYAHEPASLEAVYKALKIFNPRKIIALLGAQGGGRDKQKRPELGRIAGQYADTIIVTNEDPYDESPETIIEDVVSGLSQNTNPKTQIPNYEKIIDRREAIKKALSLAQTGDIVIMTGKGGEVWMCVENGRKISWNEREIVEEELGKLV